MFDEARFIEAHAKVQSAIAAAVAAEARFREVEASLVAAEVRYREAETAAVAAIEEIESKLPAGLGVPLA